LADEYAASNSRIRVIHNAENQYVSQARNIGMAESKGKYIIPLDGDDALRPDALQVLSDALDNDRSIHIAYGNLEILTSGGKRLHSGWPIDFNYSWQAGQRNLLPYCAMFRHQVWEETCGYRRRWRTGEDAEFWLRAASYGYRPQMVTTTDILTHRMGRPGSLSNLYPESDWAKWLSCSHDMEAAPAGAVTDHQLPVPSLDPPAVSIIIPVGPGHERLVLDAIDSVDAQTFRQWECIVVNDTGGPLGTSLPSWVRLIEADCGHSVAHARNLGIKASRAPLFVPLDADDYLQPDYLRTALWAHQESGGDLIYTDFWEDPEVEGKFRIFREYDSDPMETFKGSLPVTMLTPKVAWEQAGGYDETLPAWEDWDFQFACLARGFCFRRLAGPLWTYRKHTGWRREQNATRFEEGKQGILAKWHQYWEGSKELMACSSCGKRKTLTPNLPRTRNLPVAEGAVLVEYTGPRQASMTFRGASGTLYRFGAGDPAKYVLEEDVPMFEARVDFKRANGSGPPLAPDRPILVTEMAPKREELVSA
jgi:glycosyltransferase involved in cell wall biosynthesis